MRPRKRFGQHFLHDASVLGDFERCLGLRTEDPVVEIGPGEGALTEVLYDSVKRYVAIEIDRDLVPFLRARFDRLELHEGDILKFDLADALGDEGPAWRVVGNLPYNISSPLLEKLMFMLVSGTVQVKDMQFMLQREMAQRLYAHPSTKAWGRLSVLVQAVCEVDELFDVSPDAFRPPPKVWSSVIRLRPRAKMPTAEQLSQLQQVVRVAFSARRKTLSNALKSLELDLAKLGIEPSRRADDLSVAEYQAISTAAQTKK